MVDLLSVAQAPPAGISSFSRLSRPLQILLILLALTVLLRLLSIAFVPLMPEEAYYWMYSQHPSLSYYDHPPMVAWVIFAGNWLFTGTEFGVRICGNLMATGCVFLMYAYARLWNGKRVAAGAALMLLILPFYFWTGFIETMDSQLLFFWMLCLLGASLALRREKRWGWYLAGLGLGGAMLSKYTGIFVGAGILIALILHRPWRKHLRSPHPYLAAAMGLMLFTPVVLWNAHHDWASFRFQFLDRSEIHPLQSWRSLVSPLNFLGLQLVVVTPVFVMAALSLLIGAKRWRRLLHRPSITFSLCVALPLIASTAWKSVTYDVHVDWTAPAYLSLFPLVYARTAAFIRWSRQTNAPGWPFAAAVTAAICAGFNLLATIYLLLVLPTTGRPEVFGPWHQLATVVRKYEVQLEQETRRQPLVIGNGKYRLASELAFYRCLSNAPEKSSKNTTSQWILGDFQGLGYVYWLNRVDCKGRDCIYVTDKNDIERVVRPCFEHIQVVDDPGLLHLPGGIVYYLAICRGFKG